MNCFILKVKMVLKIDNLTNLVDNAVYAKITFACPNIHYYVDICIFRLIWEFKAIYLYQSYMYLLTYAIYRFMIPSLTLIRDKKNRLSFYLKDYLFFLKYINVVWIFYYLIIFDNLFKSFAR